MLREICNSICHNKNLLMLVTVGIYILALFSTLTGFSLIFAFLITSALVFAILKNYFPPKYALIWILIFYFGIFNTSHRIKETDELLNIAPVNAAIYGKILTIPQMRSEDKTRFFFNVEKIEYDSTVRNFDKEKVLVTLNTSDKLKIYDSYKITGRLSMPFKAGNPSQFDYGNYLRNFDTYSVLYGKEFSKIEGKKSLSENALQRINDYREKIISVHSKYLPSPNLEILGGIVFGDDAVSAPEDIKKSFINSGLLHILAASGMNVAFIFSFFYFFLSLFRVNYKVNISMCILAVIIYSLMTGLGASVIRATFMLVFVLIGKLIDRDAHSISLLSFVAFLMLVYNPMFINDVGFQLSFIVTFGLLVMTPYLVRSENKYINWIIGTVSVPVIAQLWVIPIQIFYFSNISLYSVFANIMSVPILSVISFGGFISSLVSIITPISDLVCRIFDYFLNPLLSVLVNISDFWGKLPHAAMQTTHPNVVQIIIYYLILLNITALFDKEIREKFVKYLRITLPALVLILLISTIPIKNHNLEITAFDVGNADSFLIKTPDNKYLLIDTAKSGYNGGKSQAEMILLKYLKDRGIKHIDSIIITHFDNDHCGGAVDLMKGVNVSKIYVNSLSHPSIAAKYIYKTAKERGVDVILAQNKQSVREDDVKITNYISPANTDDNESSIVTLLVYGKFKMLFTGDSGIKTFKNLKPMLPKDITVLKVGHHGAFGVVNKEMTDYLNPKVSLISVGENKFGHPSIYTLETLKNTRILRTDINNSVRFIVNKDGWKVESYDSERRQYQASW